MSDDHLNTQSLNIFRESREAAKKNREAMEALQDVVAEENPVASRGLKVKGPNTPQAASVPRDGSALDAVRVPVTPKKAVAPNKPAAANVEPSEGPNAIPKVVRAPRVVGGSVATNTPEASVTPAVVDEIPKVARAPRVVGTSVPAKPPKEPEAAVAKQAAPAQAPAPEANQKAETAGAFVSQLAVNIRFWQSSLPDDREANIVAILANGKEISIQHLASEGRHGLIIHGELNDEPCMIATHQTNLTLICTAVDKKAGVKRPELRFYVDGKKLV